ncbi:hypothetical protein MTZ49_08920 [Entomomonas sp. E2T0]|nr:hypothetical protein [Entomomonas sp. E2T0]UYZ82737.1 hypothetical protein MTZ49_08920 [Entomomonas sp. E2T0]
MVGEIAPSRGCIDNAYKLAAEPKELVIVPKANGIDLYYRADLILWNKLT